MAVINKNGGVMNLPLSIARTNPIPVDSTMVWYDFAALQEYAANGATAYVGQILAYVDEAAETTTAYIITDAAGSLSEVGSATLGDDRTISLNELTGTLALKNWGVEYYKWVDPVGEEGQDGYIEGHHEKYVMVEGDTWPAGLEPKAATNAQGIVELAWYQPSTITLQGVSSSIASMQTTIGELTAGIGSRDDAAGAETVYGAIASVEEANAANTTAIEEIQEALPGLLSKEGGEMTGDLTLADGSKATSEKVVDTKIAEAVASAGHLKREIVDSLPAVESADPDTIYMVKSGLTLTGDKYIEYMLIDGAFEQIGDTSVDLEPYAKTTDLNAAKEELANSISTVSGSLTGHIADAEKHIQEGERAAWNKAIEDIAALAGDFAAQPTISQADAEKLAALPAIKSVGDGLTLDENGDLSVVFDAYELPVASAEVLGGVKVGTGLAIDGEGALSVPVKAGNGLALGANGLEMALASADAAGAMSADMFVKLSNVAAGAEVNVVNGALLGGADGVAAEIDENRNLVLPFAAADKAGLVKSSNADNYIAVDDEGLMSLNRVSTSKLYVPEGEELVLYGGNSI